MHANGFPNTHTIFLSEGVLYLKEGVPSKILRIMKEATMEGGSESTASFCFADRLENVPGGDIDAARKELSQNGWDLIVWCVRNQASQGTRGLRD